MANHSKWDKGKCFQKSFFPLLICSNTEFKNVQIKKRRRPYSGVIYLMILLCFPPRLVVKQISDHEVAFTMTAIIDWKYSLREIFWSLHEMQNKTKLYA